MLFQSFSQDSEMFLLANEGARMEFRFNTGFRQKTFDRPSKVGDRSNVAFIFVHSKPCSVGGKQQIHVWTRPKQLSGVCAANKSVTPYPSEHLRGASREHDPPQGGPKHA